MDARTKERSAEDQTMRDETRSRVSAMADRARERAGEAADTARSKAEDIAGGQKQRATGQLESLSSALRQTSGSLRSNHQESIANYVERAASQIDRLSDYVRTRSVGELFDEAQDFARREPALFLGGAFLLGIAGSRFLKASERHHGASRRETFEMEEETVFHEPPRESFSTPGWE